MDLPASPQDKAAMRLITSRQAIARPFTAPPGVPPERVKILRDAFDATMKDPDFIKEATRLALEVRPVSGADVDKLIREIYASPPDVVPRAMEIERESAGAGQLDSVTGRERRVAALRARPERR